MSSWECRSYPEEIDYEKVFRTLGNLAFFFVLCVVIPYVAGIGILAIWGRNLLPGWLSPITSLASMFVR